MKRLKNILQSNLLIYVLIIITIIYFIIYNIIPHNSIYHIDDSFFEGQLLDMYIDGNYLSMTILSKEKIKANYYFKSKEEKDNFINKYKLGDIVRFKGKLQEPSNNTNFNIFNYKKYLYYENIYYLLEVDNYEKVKENNNVFYSLKNKMIGRINGVKGSSYLHALILGNDNYIDKDIKNVYQTIGISHLLAISGMHIGLFTSILLFILKKIKAPNKISNVVIILFLLLYMFLTGLSPSVLRSGLLFMFLYINKLFNLNIKNSNIFIIVICGLIIANPFIVYKVGFQYSAIISGVLILNKNLIKSDKYFIKLFMTSLISFLVSLPISLYHFYNINIFSILYNLLFVPLMSFILFPLSICTLICPYLGGILELAINLFEYLANVFNFSSILIFKRVNVMVYVLYFACILIILRKNKFHKYLIILLSLTLVIHYFYDDFFKSKYLITLDVGQGDSIFFTSGGESLLIDTGGKAFYDAELWKKRQNGSNITTMTIIPLLKSNGVKKLDYLIITHGDYDHMGEAINLVENFKVEKVIFNCGEFNELEKDLIKVLDKKKIPYYSCIKELNIDNNKLYFLKTRDYGNENDNSSVVYTELNNHKFLFMGDAGVEVEEDLIEKYNLQDIDVLKVGHHGSKTSSSKEFIDEINPKYSIISVGKNNKYGHPNNGVLNNLDNSKIYRTDQDGSIMFKLKNNKLKIETCTP